jgi:hypothetical protein
VRFVDALDKEPKDNLYSKSNLLQASINNFAFQTPNPNYYSTLGQFKVFGTDGINTPVGYKQHGLLSTMVGTNITNHPQVHP